MIFVVFRDFLSSQISKRGAQLVKDLISRLRFFIKHGLKLFTFYKIIKRHKKMIKAKCFIKGTLMQDLKIFLYVRIRFKSIL